MPELPPQLPARVSELPAAAPATVMSLKSQLVAEIALTVSVRTVPNALDRRNTLFTADEPAQVSVPFMVWLSEIEAVIKPEESSGAVIVRLLNVFAPVIV